MPKVHFSKLAYKCVLSQGLKDLMNMVEVLLPTLAKDKYVINNTPPQMNW